MNYKKISVIIPVYNCKSFLEQSIQSVLSQSYKNIDIILVNDGSTDGSDILCDKLAKEHENINVIHQKNAGVSAARNKGIDYILSNGEEGYIAFLDADDIWTSNFFDENILELLGDEYDLLGFQSCSCDFNGEWREKVCDLKEGTFMGGNSSIWIHATQAFGAMLYSKKLLKQYNIRFDTEAKYSEDKIFSMQALYLAGNIYLKNKLLYLYRQNIFSAMHTRKYGISHFVPIIESYKKSDNQMKKWVNEQREELRAGNTLTQIYIMDMIDEHFQTGGLKNEVDKLLQEHPDYLEILNGFIDNEQVMKPSIRYQKYKESPAYCRYKNRIKGIIVKGVRTIIRFPIINKLYRRCRYCYRI